MRALIVGAGSVGGYFGSRLAAAKRDVSFLVRPQRASQLARGLTVRSQGGDTTVPDELRTRSGAARVIGGVAAMCWSFRSYPPKRKLESVMRPR